jgi:hypothetical protein
MGLELGSKCLGRRLEPRLEFLRAFLKFELLFVTCNQLTGLLCCLMSISLEWKSEYLEEKPKQKFLMTWKRFFASLRTVIHEILVNDRRLFLGFIIIVFVFFFECLQWLIRHHLVLVFWKCNARLVKFPQIHKKPLAYLPYPRHLGRQRSCHPSRLRKVEFPTLMG